MDHFESELGGFRSSVALSRAASSGLMDLRSTAFGGLVALYMERRDVAYKAADFVLNLLLEQPHPQREFLLARDIHTRQLVVSSATLAERFRVIRRGVWRPLYYALGLAIVLLAKCAAARGDQRYVDGAEMYGEVSLAFAPECLFHDYSGKLCWGFSLLNRSPRNLRYAQVAGQIGDHICTRQLPAGCWISNELMPDRADSLGLTAEYSLWLDLAGIGLLSA
jgi:hypothetical protein